MKSEDTTKSYKKNLILIILLLLFLLSCFVIGYKLGKIHKPKYDIDPDIFEINGGKDNINDDDNNNSDNKNDGTNIDDSNNGNNQNNTNNNFTSGNNNNHNNQSNTDNSIVIDNGNNISSNVPTDDDKGFSVSDNEVNWSSTEKIDIFKNMYFNNQSKIAPGVSSTYSFVIKNNTDYTLDYQIKMKETNDYNINMKYRLKKNNEYVLGTNDTWVDASELNLNNQIIAVSNSDTYLLEWKWFDSSNDTEIGKIDNANYSLSISINAEEYGA